MNKENQWEQRRSGSHNVRNHELRHPFEIDRTRILHASAFRRLQGKTQVIGIGEGDFHRTRMTHTLEVANIARGIVQHLNDKYPNKRSIIPSNDLIESICFAHDLGHPPFGHNGELALNYLTHKTIGFEGNGQTLRIISKLEHRENNFGLDLTRRTLLGTIKYPAPYSKVKRTKYPNSKSAVVHADFSPPKCFLDSEIDVVDWVLKCLNENDRNIFVELKEKPSNNSHGKTSYKSLDAWIMDLADEIAYSIHDIEDGVALGILKREHLESCKSVFETKWAADWGLDHFLDNMFSNDRTKIKYVIGALVHAVIQSVKLSEYKIFKEPLLDNYATVESGRQTLIESFKDIAFKHFIRIQPVETLQYRGRYMIKHLFDAISSDPMNLMPLHHAQEYHKHNENNDRVICDYISGMTDNYATRLYERLYVPRLGSVFEKL